MIRFHLISNDYSNYFEPLKHILWDNNNTSGLPLTGAPWFLTALFFAYILFYLISLIRFKAIKYSCLCLVSLFGCVYSLLPFPHLPFSLDAAFVGVGFILIGNVLYTNKHLFFNLKAPLLIALLIISISNTVFNETISMNIGQYGNIMSFYVSSVSMSVVLINISVILERLLFHFLPKPFSISSQLIYVGKNSICLLCFNQLIISIIRKFFERFFIFQMLLQVC